MIFVYKAWDEFCRQLKEKGIVSIPACDVEEESGAFLVLKHDIENTVLKAFKLAEIEHKYGHRGSYYAHAYLLDDPQNMELLLKMQEMGHEISYHYDVMDSNHGDMERAIQEFDKNIKRFESLGFQIKTVCQHGNPVVERVGYTSNRDFFRNQSVQEQYGEIADIMVDYKQKYSVDYTYYSDAGRKFNMIYDPINNDIINSDDKNITYEDLNQLISALSGRAIVSTHPHRWTDSAATYLVKEKIFFVIKLSAKLAMKVPVLKKVMSRYYYLAKKI
jgi:hypothetical protein